MLFEPLFAHARENPHEIAITDDQGQCTFAQLAAMAGGLCTYIAVQTDRPSVGLLLPSGVGYAASFYGTLLAGKSIVPINYLLGEREIAHIIGDSGIDTVITVPSLVGRLKDAALKIIDLSQVPRTPDAVAPRLPSPSADDLAVLMYTSGTAGRPKGVMLTYGNLQSDVDACIEHAGLLKRHAFIGIIPLFHSFGMTATMLAPIQLGAAVIYQARFSALATLQAIRSHPQAIVFGVPSMFGAILRLESAKPADFKDVYAMISGGEPLPAVIRQGFEKRLGTTVYEGYGLTETSPVVSLNTPAMHRPTSVGKTIPQVGVRIVDDEGNVLPPGEEGEVWLKGPMIMKGYYNLPAETAAAMNDGYFKTGDLGKVDAHGYLYITGRKKDLIICAGEKVVPREVEEVLARHPAIAEAAVVGKKDSTRGETVVAFVVLHPGASAKGDELRSFCRDQGLVTFKVPREVHILPDLPRSPTGKVVKRLLADKAAMNT